MHGLAIFTDSSLLKPRGILVSESGDAELNQIGTLKMKKAIAAMAFESLYSSAGDNLEKSSRLPKLPVKT